MIIISVTNTLKELKKWNGFSMLDIKYAVSPDTFLKKTSVILKKIKIKKTKNKKILITAFLIFTIKILINKIKRIAFILPKKNKNKH
jgi:hypothetical protein